MKHRYLSLYLIAAFFLCTVASQAQVTDSLVIRNYKPQVPEYRGVVGDSAVIPQGKQDQQKQYMEGTYSMPPKPRNKWELGIHGGGMFISGDVATRGGWGAGISIRKSLGYTFSLQGLYMHGVTYGLNWQSNSGLRNNPVLNGKSGGLLNYADSVGKFFYNYKMVGDEISANILLTINNIGFHKKAIDRKVNMYGGVGVGGFIFRTWYDALDANGDRYRFDTIADPGAYPDRKSATKELKKVLDGDYETAAEGQADQPKFGEGVIKPIVNAQLGLGFHLSKSINLTIMEKIAITNDDLLDGDRWQEHPFIDPALTRDFDVYHYTYLTLGYNLGPKNSVEPLYWQNPMDYTYDALQTLMKKNVDELIDTDDDGVIDKLDKEPNTAPGAIVDTHGVTTDTDKDGVPDYQDKEPFSPPGAPVDNDGVATNTVVSGPGGGGNFCNVSNFPSVHFELNKYFIQPEYFAHLHEIAMAMISCPDKKMVAVGHTDVRDDNAYNDVLSWERVTTAIDYLVKTYNIDRNRFIVQFKGETQNIFKGLPDRFGIQPMYESRHYINRRVEFRWAAQGETGESNPGRPKGPQKVGEQY